MPDLIKIGRFSTPSVHRIALDGRTPALRNRKLRRALSMAIDRRVLLEEVLLRHPPDEVNTVSDGPFVKGSFVDAIGVEPLEYKPLLAKGLVVAARKELGGNPIRLTLEYPSIAEARAVCPRIAEAFALIGVEVQLIERTESERESACTPADASTWPIGPRGQPSRSTTLGPCSSPASTPWVRANALASAASVRILQLLIQLDRAPETTSARNQAMQIDRESRDELPIPPLWQLEDHYAWRSNLRGPSETADHLYQEIANWEIEPMATSRDDPTGPLQDQRRLGRLGFARGARDAASPRRDGSHRALWLAGRRLADLDRHQSGSQIRLRGAAPEECRRRRALQAAGSPEGAAQPAGDGCLVLAAGDARPHRPAARRGGGPRVPGRHRPWEKRSKKVDGFLKREDFARFWQIKLGDMLQISQARFGAGAGPYNAWLGRRLKENAFWMRWSASSSRRWATPRA